MHLEWHVKTTMQVATDLGLDFCAASCLTFGNAAVDLLYFDDVIRHGMTRADDHTGEPTPNSDSEREWEDWINNNIQDCFNQLDDGECCTALYALGMALHSIQDVEAHQGMTNPEHAERYVCPDDVCGGDPDTDEEAMDRGEEATRDFLQGFLESLTADDLSCLDECECDLCVFEEFLEEFDAVGLVKAALSFWLLGARWWLSDEKPPRIRW